MRESVSGAATGWWGGGGGRRARTAVRARRATRLHLSRGEDLAGVATLQQLGGGQPVGLPPKDEGDRPARRLGHSAHAGATAPSREVRNLAEGDVDGRGRAHNAAAARESYGRSAAVQRLGERGAHERLAQHAQPLRLRGEPVLERRALGVVAVVG